MQTRINEFVARGGHLHMFTADDESDALESYNNVLNPVPSSSEHLAYGRTELYQRKRTIKTVVLRPNDTVYPVSHTGQNRSQVLWALLQHINAGHSVPIPPSNLSQNQQKNEWQQVSTGKNIERYNHSTNNEVPDSRRYPLRVTRPHGAESGFDP